MGDGLLRFGVGVLGNVTSLLLFASPIVTFVRVIRMKSSDGFSCVPYTVALMNCLLYTWYGFPVVSVGWENFPVITINGVGILLELSFILIYLRFTSPQQRKKVAGATMAVLIVFVITAAISTFVVHDHKNRKILVGSIGLVASVAMYASPLVVVKQVIRTKSVEFMPFYLSFFSFLASVLWMAYGLLGHDFLLAAPNLVGCPLGMFQLVLYCIYRKNKGIEEAQKRDQEKIHDEPTIQQEVQIAVIDNNKTDQSS